MSKEDKEPTYLQIFLFGLAIFGILAVGIFLGSVLLTVFQIPLPDNIVLSKPPSEGETVCQAFDSEFLYYTNGGGIRCKRIAPRGIEIEYVFKPLEYWEKVYSLDWTSVALPGACHIPSGDCD